MEKLSTGIIGVSQMRWTDSDQCVIKNHQLYFSVNPKGEHINGKNKLQDMLQTFLNNTENYTFS